MKKVVLGLLAGAIAFVPFALQAQDDEVHDIIGVHDIPGRPDHGIFVPGPPSETPPIHEFVPPRPEIIAPPEHSIHA